jgi:hypothetical protein
VQKRLISILLLGAIGAFNANAGTYLEKLRDAVITAYGPELPALQQKLDKWNTEDAGFKKAMQDYYGIHSSIQVGEGIVIVSLQDRWRFVNRDLSRRAKIVSLVYLDWHPEEDSVKALVKDFEDGANEYISRSDYSSGQAIRQEITTLREEAGLNRKPFNDVELSQATSSTTSPETHGTSPSAEPMELRHCSGLSLWQERLCLQRLGAGVRASEDALARLGPVYMAPFEGGCRVAGYG